MIRYLFSIELYALPDKGLMPISFLAPYSPAHFIMCFRNLVFPLGATELYALLDKGLTPISFFAPYLPIPPHWKRDKARIQMCKLFEGVMQRRIAENRTENDVLQVLPASHTHKNTPYPPISFFAP